MNPTPGHRDDQEQTERSAVVVRGDGFRFLLSPGSARLLAAELRELARPPALSATLELAAALANGARTVELGASHRVVAIRALEHCARQHEVVPTDLLALYSMLRNSRQLTYRLLADGIPQSTIRSACGAYYLAGDRIVDREGRSWEVESTQLSDPLELTLKDAIRPRPPTLPAGPGEPSFDKPSQGAS